MYQPGDQVLYGIHGVCRILDVEERRVDRKRVEYYVLEPLEQPGSRYYVPTQNAAAVAKLRPMLTQPELDALLHSDAVRQDSWIADENARKLRYRDLINSGDRGALISMVSTLHRHKQSQTAAGRKFHQCDENFLRDAEKLLNSEFARVLNLEENQVMGYVLKQLHAE